MDKKKHTDDKKLRETLEWAAEKGDHHAMYEIGCMDENDGNADAALKWFLKAATRGDQRVWFKIAAMHVSGDGVPKNPLLSYLWLALIDFADQSEDPHMKIAMNANSSPDYSRDGVNGMVSVD